MFEEVFLCLKKGAGGWGPPGPPVRGGPVISAARVSRDTVSESFKTGPLGPVFCFLRVFSRCPSPLARLPSRFLRWELLCVGSATR